MKSESKLAVPPRIRWVSRGLEIGVTTIVGLMLNADQPVLGQAVQINVGEPVVYILLDSSRSMDRLDGGSGFAVQTSSGANIHEESVNCLNCSAAGGGSSRMAAAKQVIRSLVSSASNELKDDAIVAFGTYAQDVPPPPTCLDGSPGKYTVTLTSNACRAKYGDWTWVKDYGPDACGDPNGPARAQCDAEAGDTAGNCPSYYTTVDGVFASESDCENNINATSVALDTLESSQCNVQTQDGCRFSSDGVAIDFQYGYALRCDWTGAINPFWIADTATDLFCANTEPAIVPAGEPCEGQQVSAGGTCFDNGKTYIVDFSKNSSSPLAVVPATSSLPATTTPPYDAPACWLPRLSRDSNGDGIPEAQPIPSGLRTWLPFDRLSALSGGKSHRRWLDDGTRADHNDYLDDAFLDLTDDATYLARFGLGPDTAGETPLAEAIRETEPVFHAQFTKMVTTGDVGFECRSDYLIVITDGEESCGGDPTARIRGLRERSYSISGNTVNRDIRTFVIALGDVLNSQNRAIFNAMAKAGIFNTNNTESDLARDVNRLADTTPNDANKDYFFRAANGQQLGQALQEIFNLIAGKQFTRSAPTAPTPAATEGGNRAVLLSTFQFNEPNTTFPYNSWEGHIKRFEIKTTAAECQDSCNRTCGGDQQCLRQCNVCLENPCAAAGDSDECWRGEGEDGVPNSYALSSQTIDGAAYVEHQFHGVTSPNPARKIVTAKAGFPLSDPFVSNDTVVESFDESNSNLTAAVLSSTGLPVPSNEVTNLIRFVRGRRDSYQNGFIRRWLMGTSVHALPATVTAPKDPPVRGMGYWLNFRTQAQYAQRGNLMVIAANDGMIHAFDVDRTADSGKVQELWAYLPRFMLNKLYSTYLAPKQTFLLNGPSVATDVCLANCDIDQPPPTGADWATVVLTGTGFEVDGPGYVTALRLRHRYVSDAAIPTEKRRAPQPLWEFSNSTLGRATSQPIIGKVATAKSGSNFVLKWMAFFGGGQDSGVPAIGRSFYALDIAKTNPNSTWTVPNDTRIFSAPSSKTGASLGANYEVDFVARPTVLDINKNGLADNIWIGGTDGLIYHVDLKEAGCNNSDCEQGWEFRQFFDPRTDQTDVSISDPLPPIETAATTAVIDGQRTIVAGSGSLSSFAGSSLTHYLYFIKVKDQSGKLVVDQAKTNVYAFDEPGFEGEQVVTSPVIVNGVVFVGTIVPQKSTSSNPSGACAIGAGYLRSFSASTGEPVDELYSPLDGAKTDRVSVGPGPPTAPLSSGNVLFTFPGDNPEQGDAYRAVNALPKSRDVFWHIRESGWQERP